MTMDYNLYVGVDIGGTKISVSLGTAGGVIEEQFRFPTPPDTDTAIRAIGERIDRILSHQRTKERVAAIGVSCGGPLDAERGIIQSPPNLPGWDDIPVTNRLSAETGLPCYLENDANAGALAEWYWGNGQGCTNLIFLTFGTGLGAGLILNGRLYSGTTGLAGEVGHVRLSGSGPHGYGKNGSWEGYCSGGGIQRHYFDRTGTTKSAKEICEEARSGNSDAGAVIEESARYLGAGIAWLIDVLNPESIIIGSIFSRNESLFRPTMEQIIADETLPRSRTACRILPAGLGESLGDHAALGVALYGSADR